MKYRATIVSPQGAAPASSSIEFESEYRAGSKQNIQDAIQEQLMLDFREPTEEPKRKRRSVKRGIA